MPLLGSRGAGSAKGFGFSGGGVAPVDFDYLVVAGGGAGQQPLGGGGGGGGHRSSFPGGTKITVNTKTTDITVGAGGVGPFPGGHGVDSSVGAFLVSAGGGAMRSGTDPADSACRDGGSGAGQTHQQTAFTGLGNTPPVSPSQGYPGGPGGGSFGASGGGGAGAAGNNGTVPGNPTNNSGPGGSGASNSITGSSVTRAGGGGGGPYTAGGGSGGSGGGGSADTAGSVNTGGGGGGPNPGGSPVSGGSGIVYLRVPTALAPATMEISPGTNTITDVGADKLLTFTVSGTLTI
tara:strand:+ start:187 stop:1059 length:873 start_codon:yes stop_codon:yes gene_type:complete